MPSVLRMGRSMTSAIHLIWSVRRKNASGFFPNSDRSLCGLHHCCQRRRSHRVFSYRSAQNAEDSCRGTNAAGNGCHRQVNLRHPDELVRVPGNLPILRKSLEANIALLDRLLSTEPERDVAARTKAVNYTRIGEAWERLGDVKKAEEFFTLSLQLSTAQSAQHPDDGRYHRDIAVPCAKLGSLRLDAGKAAEALALFLQMLNHTQLAFAQSREATDAKHDLAVCYAYIAAAHRAMQHFDEATKADSKRIGHH